MWKVAAVFLATLALGFAAARMGTAVPPTAAVSTSGSRSPAPRPATRWRTGDFLAWTANASSRQATHPLAEDLKSWSDSELHAALDEGLANPGWALEGGSASTLCGALLSEWMTRDFDAGLAWFEAIPRNFQKSRLSYTIALCWPKDRAAEALNYVFDHRHMFRTDRSITYAPIVEMAVGAAAKQGPAAVEALLGELRDHQIEPRYTSNWEFPAGFDFTALVARPEGSRLSEMGCDAVAAAWLKQNRDEAFENLLVQQGVKGSGIARELSFYVAPPGDANSAAVAERTRWLAGKLDELEPEQRRSIALASVGSLTSVPQALGGFTAALTDPDDRLAVGAGALKAVADYGLGKSFEFLEAAGDTEFRLSLLENLEITPYSRRYLVPGQEALLRTKLAEWNIPAARVDAVVRHLREVKR